MTEEEVLKGVEQFKKDPQEFLEWLRKDPKEPEKGYQELRYRIAPTCKYCGAIAQITEDGVFCSEDGRELTKEEIVKADLDEETITKVNTIARKGARLFLKASKKSDKVYEHLVKTLKQGDKEWQKLLKTIGKKTPEIGREINNLNMPPFMTGWCVLSVKFLYEHHDEI